MAEPETRAINRCTYTPVVNSAEIGDVRPGFVPKQPFITLAALRTVFPDPQAGRAVLSELPAHDRAVYAQILELAWTGDTTGAIAHLSALDRSDVLAFSKRALDVHHMLLDRAETTLMERASTWTADVDEQQVRAELTVRAPTVAQLLFAGRRVPDIVLRPVPKQPVVPAPREPQITVDVPDPPSADEPTVLLPPAGFTRVGTPGAKAAGGTVPPPPESPPAAPSAAPAAQDSLALSARSADVASSRLSPAASITLSPAASELAPATLAGAALRTHTSAVVAKLLAGLQEQRQTVDYRRDILRSVDVLGLAEPLGFLHLERMQFTPVGYVRGELVYSLPLLPGETVRLTHREWSRTETEYTTLVATTAETAIDEAVSEKSELTESTSKQQQHTAAFSTSVTASGGFGPMHFSSSVGYNVANSDANSRSSSSRHAQEITKAASTRAKKEHKITFRLTTTTEVEDVSYREISNSRDTPVRWDYYRLMRQWRIDLYRYDVRLTYDVVVPEPGSYLLRAYQEIAWIDQALRQPFELRGSDSLFFHGSPTEINRRNWEALAAFYNVALNPPPEPFVTVQAHAEHTYTDELVGTGYLTITLPEGYRFSRFRLDDPHPSVRDSNGEILGQIHTLEHLNRVILEFSRDWGQGRLNSYQWRYVYDWSENHKPPKGTVLSIGITAIGVPTRQTIKAWQQECYERIVDAARTRFEARQQELAARRAELVAMLDREDALALRKMEREEIMKAVLRWVLGHHFTFYPSSLPDLDTVGDDLEYYSPQTGLVRDRFLDLQRNGEVLARYTQQIRFLQQAIEWENVNYILYPYFWTDPQRWDIKQALYHPDFEHRAFLRAGAARVVLTIRPSYEKAFLSFMETGRLDQLLDADHVYMTVADELKAYATTNDRYTVAANAENPMNLVDTWFEFTPTGALDVVGGSTLDPAEPN